MSEPTCQWCGAGVKTRFCEPDTGFTQMILFHCDAEYYPQEGDEAWSRRPTLKCGQRCAEQMRRLRAVSCDTATTEQLEQLGLAVGTSGLAWDDASPWEIIAAVVRVAVSSVTEGG